MLNRHFPRILLSSCFLLLAACGGGGGGNDGYLLGGGNEGTGGISVKSVQISGSVIDEAEQAVSGATAIINDQVATPIDGGKFSAPIALQTGPRKIKIAIERPTKGIATVSIDAVDSAETEAVNAFISVDKDRASLEDVEIVKRGTGEGRRGSIANDLNKIDDLVNDRPTADRNTSGQNGTGSAEPTPRPRPDLDPDLVDL